MVNLKWFYKDKIIHIFIKKFVDCPVVDNSPTLLEVLYTGQQYPLFFEESFLAGLNHT